MIDKYIYAILKRLKLDMKTFLYKFYLKRKIKILRIQLYIYKFLKFIITFSVFLKEFIFETVKYFKGLNKSYKIYFLLIVGLISLGGGVFFNKVYSSNIADISESQSVTSNSSSTQSYAYVPQNAIESEYLQFVQMGNTIVQGTTNSDGSKQNGLLGMLYGADIYLYSNNPVSAIQYAKYYGVQHSLIKDTYAATATSPTGSGYYALQPITPIWEICRNIAYLVTALMIVVVGFIIIMGGKYGQMEVSVVNSIPKIIFGLLLITFSYPIAGFFIDISNLTTNILVQTLAPNFADPAAYSPGEYPLGCAFGQQEAITPYGGDSDPNNQKTQVKACNYNYKYFTPGGEFNVFRLMAPIMNYQNWSSKDANNIVDIIQWPTNIGWLDSLLSGNDIVKNLSDYTVGFIMNILILFWSIKIFILVFTSFIRIVMMSMFGPLILIPYPLSGEETLIKWLKNLLSPALVFPVVFAMMFIAAILAFGTQCPGTTNANNGNDAKYSCATVGKYDVGPWYIRPNERIQNFGSGPLLFVDTINPQFVWNFVALGIIVAIPSVGKQLDQLLQSEISQHVERSGQEAGQYARNLATKIPVVGGIIGKVL